MTDQQRLWRSFAAVILLFAFVRFQVSLAHAGLNRWTAHGPEGGDIRSFAIDPGNPQVVYVVTNDVYNRVFKSADGGNTWTPIEFGVSEFELTAFIVVPQTPMVLYASGGAPGGGIAFGVLKSTDGGSTWQASNDGLTDTNVRTLAIDATLPTTLYAATWTGVFKSTNGGASWALLSPSLLSPSFFDLLVIDPKTPTTLYATLSYSGDGILKSIDGGVNWVPVNDGLPPHPGISFITIDPATPTTLYAGPFGGGTFNGVYKSIDGGANWGPINTDLLSGPLGIVVRALAVDPLAPTTLYAATEQGVYKSTTGGTNWTQTNTGIPDHTKISAIAIDPQTSSTVYAGTGGNGVFKSTDAAHTWTARNSGIIATQITTFSSDPTNPQILYVGTTSGVFKSTDGAIHWELKNQGLPAPATSLAIDPQTPTTLYAATEQGVFKSFDSGQTWIAKNNGITNRATSTITISPLPPTTLYVGTTSTFDNGGIFTSTDGGETWSPANTGLPANPGDRISISTLAIDPKTPTTLYAGVNAINLNSRPIPFSNIFKSTDGGMTWSVISEKLPFGPLNSIFSLAIDPQTPTTVYASVLFYVGPGGVMKSTDGGKTWDFSNDGFTTLTPHLSALVIDPLLPTTLYAGTNTMGIFKSTDGGVHWVPMNAGLSNPSITALAIDPVTGKRLYAGTQGGGVFAFEVSSESADLSITQSDSPDPVQAGDNLTYSFTITNNGPSDATGVKVTDTIPSGVTVVSATPSQGNCTGQGTVVCELETLANQTTAMVTLVVKLPLSGNTGGMSNTVSVSNIEPDPRTDNNTTTEVTTVTAGPGPDLTGFWRKLKQKCKKNVEKDRCRTKATFVVQNQGERDTPSTTLKILLVGSFSFNPLVGQVDIPPLRRGKQKRVKLTVQFPHGGSLSGTPLRAEIDPDNGIAETNESNNSVLSPPIQ